MELMITKESGLIVQHGCQQKMIKGTVPIVLVLADAPTKGSNTRPPGDNSPTPITLPPPVMNTPTSDGQASELHQFQLYLQQVCHPKL